MTRSALTRLDRTESKFDPLHPFTHPHRICEKEIQTWSTAEKALVFGMSIVLAGLDRHKRQVAHIQGNYAQLTKLRICKKFLN